ncbi:MAG TPA: HPF/RaiA family ribosome-associated protein [Terriglobales bacterium]|nr:HPF/RaiA family ribosome-associated protein [Terriglobales bacterium]
MQTIVRINEAELAEVFKSYVERRLRFALGRFGSRVGQITVRITGGGREEHRCRISAEVLPFGRVAVEEADMDLFSALDRATGRIGRLFGRELERVREARIGRDSIRMAA